MIKLLIAIAAAFAGTYLPNVFVENLVQKRQQAISLVFPDALDMLLDRIHAESRRLGIKEVQIDLRQLEFMNSSCFKSFVSWITNIQEMDADRQYKVTFLSNPNMHWQKRSLHALSCLANEIVTINS